MECSRRDASIPISRMMVEPLRKEQAWYKERQEIGKYLGTGKYQGLSKDVQDACLRMDGAGSTIIAG